jgi:hypothetical protein
MNSFGLWSRASKPPRELLESRSEQPFQEFRMEQRKESELYVLSRKAPLNQIARGRDFAGGFDYYTRNIPTLFKTSIF